MIVFVEEIPGTGLNLNEVFDIDTEDIVEKSRFITPVSAEIRIIKKEDKVVVKGKVSAVIEVECSRCLTFYPEKIESSFDLILYPEEDYEFDEDRELTDDDINTIFFKEGIIDIDSIIIDQINLSIPYKPLCSEECKGLCPVCGKNLNEGPCGCEIKKKDPRVDIIIETLRGK
jgi:uncharacterized protein